MPTEAIFKGLTFRDSRDYRGDDFREYLTPKSYRPFSDYTGFGKTDELIDQGRLIAINQPYPLTKYGRFSQRQVKANQVSPNPIQFGTYTENTTMLVYYWLDREQLATVYTIVPFKNINVDQLSDEETRTIYQSVVLWITENLGRAAARQAEQGESDNKGRLSKIIDWFKSRHIGNAIGVWVQSSRAVESLEDVTGVSFDTMDSSNGLPLRNRGKADGVKGEPQTGTVNPLPFIISGLGILTGSPVVFGAGLLVSYLERTK